MQIKQQKHNIMTSSSLKVWQKRRGNGHPWCWCDWEWSRKGEWWEEERGSGGGEEARGEPAQSLPSLCSVGVSDARQPFWCAALFVCWDLGLRQVLRVCHSHVRRRTEAGRYLEIRWRVRKWERRERDLHFLYNRQQGDDVRTKPNVLKWGKKTWNLTLECLKS